MTGWLDKTRKYADFLVSFAEQHHFTFGAGDDEGWLVQDYWHPNGESSPTHASLNHHAAEAEFLYRMADAVMRTATPSSLTAWCAALSRANLLWYKPDGDLNYSYQAGRHLFRAGLPVFDITTTCLSCSAVCSRHGQENPAIAVCCRSS